MDKGFSEILRDYVLEQKQKNPSFNETAISKKMDIPPTTFNRLVNGHSKPTVRTLLKLSQFIPELKSLLPEEILKVFKVTMDRENSEYVGETLETLLSDENIFLCWMLTFSDKGVTVDEIRNHLGQVILLVLFKLCDLVTVDEIRNHLGQAGVKAVRTLEKNNILTKSDSGYYKVKEKNKYAIFSFRLIKAHFLFLAKQYEPDNIKRNYICYKMSFLNEKAKKELIQIHQSFHNKIQRFMDDEKNKGDEPVFSISCSDTLLG